MILGGFPRCFGSPPQRDFSLFRVTPPSTVRCFGSPIQVIRQVKDLQVVGATGPVDKSTGSKPQENQKRVDSLRRGPRPRQDADGPPTLRREGSLPARATDMHPYAGRPEALKPLGSVDPHSILPEPSQSPVPLRCFHPRSARWSPFRIHRMDESANRHRLSGKTHLHSRHTRCPRLPGLFRRGRLVLPVRLAVRHMNSRERRLQKRKQLARKWLLYFAFFLLLALQYG